MKHSFRSHARTSSTSLLRHRPALERFEPRLPPGDAVLGLILAWPDLASPIASDLNHDLIAPFKSADKTSSFVTHRRDAIQEPDGGAAPSEARPSHSADQRAIELIPALRPASINPNAVHASMPPAPDTTSTIENVTPSASRIPALAAPHVFGNAAPAATPILPTGPTIPTLNADAESKASENYGNLPLTFEANHGQTDASVDFIARTGAGTVFLTPTSAVFALQNSEFGIQNSESENQLAVFGSPTQHSALATQHSSSGAAIHMQIVGANPDAQPTGVNRQPGIVNYFIGNDPNQWHANIPTFGGVQYDDVYPGIDLAYYGNNGQLEYDFIVSPGVDPNVIALNFAGVDGVEINPHGDLVIHTAVGNLTQQRPYIYQEINGSRQQVAGEFKIRNPKSEIPNSTVVTFSVGHYDPTRPLVIDPVVLGYSTFLGGTRSDAALGIAVDSGGSAYVAGNTYSRDFPTTPGAFDTTYNGNYYVMDVFVVKLRADGAGLLYSTYLGGRDLDWLYGIAIDAGGSAYVTGYTSSKNFPTTPASFDTSYNGPEVDAFVVKLNPTGSALDYATFLGGAGEDIGFGIATDHEGHAYVTGYTTSGDFPTTPGTYDDTSRGVFVTKLNTDGSGLSYSTFLGGGLGGGISHGISVDESGNAYVVGDTPNPAFPTTPGAFDTTFNGAWDTFVTKLNDTGNALLYSTFVGGGGDDEGFAIALGSDGSAYVTGWTQSTNFPTTAGAFDTTKNLAFDSYVTKLNPAGSALAYSTYLGGFDDDSGYGIAVDADGSAYVTGRTGYSGSNDFPTTPDAIKRRSRDNDAFVTKMAPSGATLVYSTYLGGGGIPPEWAELGWAIALDSDGNFYVAGQTASSTFPTTPGAFDTSQSGGPFDAFVTKFAEV